MVASCLAYQFYFCFYFIMPFAWFKVFTVTRLLYLASWEWFYTVIVAEIDPKLWSYPVIAGLPQARAWGQAGDAEMWFASQCPARHFSRCFVAYSFEIRRHNFPKTINTGRRLLVREGCIMRFGGWGGCIVPGDATPCCSCCVCCRSCLLTFEEKRPHEQQERKENVRHMLMKTIV